MAVVDQVPRRPLSPSQLAALAIGFVLALYVAWIGAWILEQWLEYRWGVLTTSGSRSAYWLVMKLLLWITPAVVLIHLSNRSVREVMAFERVRAILIWGGGVGLLLGLTAFVTKSFFQQPLFSAHLSWSLFSGVIVAPIIEEFTFRGAVMGALETRMRFHLANLLTSALFVGAHFPGWYFQGRLLLNLTTPIGGAFSLFLLGLLFGYVVHRSKSVAAGSLTHILNNLFSA
jgi:membrane protease YdiL (CAAX protease family)